MKKISRKDDLFIASLLFGLFFGAGNLIFPIYMGYLTGENTWQALFGFLLAGVGLPFLGVIAMAVSGSASVYQIASQASERFARLFTVALYLVIGPLFALPRLATASFEIGVASYFDKGQTSLALSVFSFLFFGIAYLFARRPSRLLDYIGKILNPLFLGSLFILIVAIFLKPENSFVSGDVNVAYQSHAFFKGFLAGYNTLDALAALAFGVIISTSVKNLGIDNKKEIARTIFRAGSIGMIGMGIVYTLLILSGAMTNGILSEAQNGGVIIAYLSNHYLGQWGSVLLSVIIIVACLKTAIGLVSSFANTFEALYPQVNYLNWARIASVVPMVIANFGLTAIIDGSLPVLMLIYPLAIVLIGLTLLNQKIPISSHIFKLSLIITWLAAIPSALLALPKSMQSSSVIQPFIQLGSFLPLGDFGLGWLLPAIIGIVIGKILEIKNTP